MQNDTERQAHLISSQQTYSNLGEQRTTSHITHCEKDRVLEPVIIEMQ